MIVAIFIYQWSKGVVEKSGLGVQIRTDQVQILNFERTQST